jgi:hypothetical protein
MVIGSVMTILLFMGTSKWPPESIPINRRVRLAARTRLTSHRFRSLKGSAHRERGSPHTDSGH